MGSLVRAGLKFVGKSAVGGAAAWGLHKLTHWDF